jgi:DNA mismatch repair protein MutL
MITILPDVIASQIAAGEVIDRPVSIVRELVDNALDSGAKNVEVSFDRGGLATVVVADDGCGMSPEDAQLAFHRHATSKLSTITDLDTLTTRGFRGEALPSIASVARVTLTTRPLGPEFGFLVRVEGGQVVETSASAGKPGTRVEVRHLFYNTPARRKFLRSPRAEASRIIDWVRKTSLGAPHVRFHIIQDGETHTTLEAVETPLERAAQFVSGTLAALSRSENGVAIEGLVTFGAHGKSTFDGVTVCVNRRVVSDRTVVKAIRQACRGVLQSGQQPEGIVFLTLPPEVVDVNVHPQKSEVRFADGQFVFRFVYGAMSRALEDFKAIPQVSLVSQSQNVEKESPYRMPQTYLGNTGSSFRMPSYGNNFGNRRNAALTLEQTASIYQAQTSSFIPIKGTLPRESSSRLTYSDLRYLGTISSCYLLCEGEDGLIVVDMHAAHERINYNRIFTAIKEKALKKQPLLLPLEISLSSVLWDDLQLENDLLDRCGFTVEFPRSPCIFVRDIPEFLLHVKDKCTALRDIFESIGNSSGYGIDIMLDGIAARLACHASVRAGDTLGTDEVYALFSDLEKAEQGALCPHGRPVAVHITESELERLFGRA